MSIKKYVTRLRWSFGKLGSLKNIKFQRFYFAVTYLSCCPYAVNVLVCDAAFKSQEVKNHLALFYQLKIGRVKY